MLVFVVEYTYGCSIRIFYFDMKIYNWYFLGEIGIYNWCGIGIYIK